MCKINIEIVISKSNKANKQYDARIDGTKTVSFGQKGASDYTKHKDLDRNASYIARHTHNEDCTKSGVKTAGWMSKNIIWSKPTLQASVDDINKRFKF